MDRRPVHSSRLTRRLGQGSCTSFTVIRCAILLQLGRLRTNMGASLIVIRPQSSSATLMFAGEVLRSLNTLSLTRPSGLTVLPMHHLIVKHGWFKSGSWRPKSSISADSKCIGNARSLKHVKLFQMEYQVCLATVKQAFRGSRTWKESLGW